jgi:hypothetical protein
MRWIARGGSLVMALLFAAGARAQERPKPAPAPQQGDGGAGGHPLSVEDLELLKELPLLERMELLRNLDHFEPEDAGPPKEEPKD